MQVEPCLCALGLNLLNETNDLVSRTNFNLYEKLDFVLYFSKEVFFWVVVLVNLGISCKIRCFPTVLKRFRLVFMGALLCICLYS